MTLQRIEHEGGAAPTALTGDIASNSTTLVVADATDWPDGGTGPFFIVIDPGEAVEEKLLCQTRSGTTLNVATSGRGADSTQAAAHSAGAVVEHCYTAVEADDDNAHIYTTSRDDHTQYMLVDGSRDFSGTTPPGMIASGRTAALMNSRSTAVDGTNPPTVNVGPLFLATGSVVLTTTSTGGFTVTFDTAFPNDCITVVCCHGDFGTLDSTVITALTQTVSATGFIGAAFISTTGAGWDTKSIRVNYIASGW